MSQPRTTSQNPKPPSTAEKNLSRWMYFPRRMPSMSETATFTLPTWDLRIASTIGCEPLIPALLAFAMPSPVRETRGGNNARTRRGSGFQERAQEGKVGLRLLVERHVRAAGEDLEARVGKRVVYARAAGDRQLVVLAAEHQAGNAQLAQLRDQGPVADVAGVGELVRALDRLVRAHVPLRERARERLGPLVEAADVAVVEERDRRLVLGVLDGAGSLAPLHHLHGLVSQGGAQLLQLFDEVRRVAVAVGEDILHDRALVAQREFGPQPRAPRVAEKAVALEAHRAHHLLQLRDVASERPQRFVLGAVGLAAAKLVVRGQRPAVRDEREVGRQQVVAREPGAAVQEQQHLGRI